MKHFLYIVACYRIQNRRRGGGGGTSLQNWGYLVYFASRKSISRKFNLNLVNIVLENEVYFDVSV